MIRHIVFFSVRDRSKVEAIISRLEDLGTIPGSASFSVRKNLKADLFGNDIDIVVYAEFPDLGALHVWKEHPTYDAVTQDVRPQRELRFAADVET